MHAAIRWLHWINFPLLTIMIWSGLLIYWANDVYRIGIGGFTAFHFFPDAVYSTLKVNNRLAEGMAWHFVFMWLFAINGAVNIYETQAQCALAGLAPPISVLRRPILIQ